MNNEQELYGSRKVSDRRLAEINYHSVYDITEKIAMEQEKKRVEQQIQHTRQIQSIASLAGGISQQFNNSLSVIYGNLDLLEHNLLAGQSITARIIEIREASDYLRSMTDQLLAYAQGGKYQPKDFSANDLIQELLHTSKITPEFSTPISTKFNPDVLIQASDITQIKMVVEAVLANAVESIKGEGEVTKSTQHKIVLEGDIETDMGLTPGRYALITIEDQGTGMDQNTKQRIFEPFFSTKFVGRGLGMAAAFGIVKNHNGIIFVHSEPKKGTQVMIYLPGVDETTQKAPTN